MQQERFPYPSTWTRAEAIEAFGSCFVQEGRWSAPLFETLGTGRLPGDPLSNARVFPGEAAAVAHVRQAAREEATREIGRIDALLETAGMRVRLTLARNFTAVRKREVGVLATESLLDHRRREYRKVLHNGVTPEVRRLPPTVRLPLVVPLGLTVHVVDTRGFPGRPVEVREDRIARRHVLRAEGDAPYDAVIRYELEDTPGLLSYDLPALERGHFEGSLPGLDVFLLPRFAEAHMEAFSASVRRSLGDAVPLVAAALAPAVEGRDIEAASPPASPAMGPDTGHDADAAIAAMAAEPTADASDEAIAEPAPGQADTGPETQGVGLASPGEPSPEVGPPEAADTAPGERDVGPVKPFLTAATAVDSDEWDAALAAAAREAMAIAGSLPPVDLSEIVAPSVPDVPADEAGGPASGSVAETLADGCEPAPEAVLAEANVVEAAGPDESRAEAAEPAAPSPAVPAVNAADSVLMSLSDVTAIPPDVAAVDVDGYAFAEAQPVAPPRPPAHVGPVDLDAEAFLSAVMAPVQDPEATPEVVLAVDEARRREPRTGRLSTILRSANPLRMLRRSRKDADDAKAQEAEASLPTESASPAEANPAAHAAQEGAAAAGPGDVPPADALPAATSPAQLLSPPPATQRGRPSLMPVERGLMAALDDALNGIVAEVRSAHDAATPGPGETDGEGPAGEDLPAAFVPAAEPPQSVVPALVAPDATEAGLAARDAQDAADMEDEMPFPELRAFLARGDLVLVRPSIQPQSDSLALAAMASVDPSLRPEEGAGAMAA